MATRGMGQWGALCTGTKPRETPKHTRTHARPPFRLSTRPGAGHQVCLLGVSHEWSCDSSSVQGPPARPQGSKANEAHQGGAARS